MEKPSLYKLVKVPKMAPEKGEAFTIAVVVGIIKKMDSLQ